MAKEPALSNGKRRARRKTSKRRTYGPIPDLQSYLRPDWWRSLFGSLYLKTDGDVVGDERITRMEVDRICELVHLQPDEDILDLCCGQGRHSLEMVRRGYRSVHGLDRSRFLIRKAKSLATNEGLSVDLREGDARKLPYSPDSFEVVLLLGNSFGYFENPSEDVMVLKEVFRVLKPSGRFLLDVADGEYVAAHYEARSWEWIDDRMFVCRERMLVQKDRLICREVITHVEKGVLTDQIYAERLYTKSDLQGLLKTVGFTEVVVQDNQEMESSRNQDLGMMARRIFVTASARKEWTPRPARKREFIQVAVILGDPEKSDPIKPNNTFDEDDFSTIDELKTALGSISGRKFVYIKRHDRLLNDLVRLRPKIDYVLNLCDEGYDNDPRKELHVPALLEILGIPYTGSGPRCLASCYDKSMIKGIAQEMGIPVPLSSIVLPDAQSIEIAVSYPVIVKPNLGDSSFGIFADSVVESEEALVDAVSRLREQFGYDKPILVEEFLTGKDLTVGIIGQPGGSYQVLPITQEDYSTLPPDLPRICGYEAKWCPDSPYWKIKTIPADLLSSVEETIVEWCLLLAGRVECRDYFRFDWRLDGEGSPRLLEANPNPGWCWDGHLVKAAALAGMSYADAIHSILAAAEERIGITEKVLKRLGH